MSSKQNCKFARIALPASSIPLKKLPGKSNKLFKALKVKYQINSEQKPPKIPQKEHHTKLADYKAIKDFLSRHLSAMYHSF